MQGPATATGQRRADRRFAAPRCASIFVFAAVVCCAPAQACSFGVAVPSTWQHADTAVATLRLPRDADTQRDAGGEPGSHRFSGDGITVLVDYGPARRPPEPESGMVSRMLGGAPAFIVSEDLAGGAGRIAITWAELGHAQLEASITIDYADAARRNDACRIASSLRLRGDAGALTLLRTGRSAGQRYAVLRDADGREQRIGEGDYVAICAQRPIDHDKLKKAIESFA